MRARLLGFLTVCTNGCYKHYDKATGTWVCCQCDC